eukprot:6468363-Pyramimonas_sp.AAC.1
MASPRPFVTFSLIPVWPWPAFTTTHALRKRTRSWLSSSAPRRMRIRTCTCPPWIARTAWRWWRRSPRLS